MIWVQMIESHRINFSVGGLYKPGYVSGAAVDDAVLAAQLEEERLGISYVDDESLRRKHSYYSSSKKLRR